METSIQFFEPRHNSELKLSHEEAAPGAQAQWCDLHCEWLQGRFQKSVYPEANRLNGPDHLGQSVKKLGRGAQWQVTEDKTYSAGSVTLVDTKKWNQSVKSWKSLQHGGGGVNLKFADSRGSAHATLQYKRTLAVAIWSNKQPLASLGDAKVNLHNQKPRRT